jgi:hypothetical protein
MATVLSSDTASERWLKDQLVDQLIELYVGWREASRTVWLAYQLWADADRGERKLAYAGYLAALDREQQTARVYAEQIESVRRVHT